MAFDVLNGLPSPELRPELGIDDEAEDQGMQAEG